MPRRTGTNKCLGHKLMHVLRFLVWVWVTVTKLLNSSPAYGFYITVNVMSKRTGTAPDRASLKDFYPAAVRIPCPQPSLVGACRR